MDHVHTSRTERRSRAGTVPLLVVALVLGVLAAPLLASGPATAAGGGAAATVGNGLTTTDLNAVGMTPTALASALVGPGVTVSNVTFSGANAQAGAIRSRSTSPPSTPAPPASPPATSTTRPPPAR